jgi:hypothetical protein|tara:strand:- start:1843 stop:2754 length:912 start_codon:yes stop_codon:yes gene_type:complete
MLDSLYPRYYLDFAAEGEGDGSDSDTEDTGNGSDPDAGGGDDSDVGSISVNDIYYPPPPPPTPTITPEPEPEPEPGPTLPTPPPPPQPSFDPIEPPEPSVVQPVAVGVTVVTPGTTISFSERSKGWVSFKTIDPEVAFSLNNEYYTAKDGVLWKHHDDSVDRNSFYNTSGVKDTEINSSITVLFNDLPSVIKSFTTLNYEGSQSRIIQNLSDDKHYNNLPKVGWHVNSVITDKQTGAVTEFISKEGKWFNYIIGEETTWINGEVDDGVASQAPITGTRGNLDTQEFSTQGIGVLTNTPVITTS